MPNERVAIDVVLLPDLKLYNTLIGLNKTLLSKFENKIVLGEKQAIPHLTLAMGIVFRGSLEDITATVHEVAGQYEPFTLTSAGIRVSSEGFSALQIRNTPLLQELHELIVKRIEPHLLPEATESMFHGEKADESTLRYVTQFTHENSLKKYSPHFTIGYGTIGEDSIPTPYPTSTIALCQLGNYCTCAKLLTKAKLT